MQAIILAAGMGKRLKRLTQNNTKCMIKVNGVTLIERMLRQLDKLHLNKIIIVVGYEGNKLIDFVNQLSIVTEIEYIFNHIYNKTNNIYSLSLAKGYMKRDDTILLESDLIFEDSVLECLLEDSRETLALVDKYENWMDGTCLKLNNNNEIEAFVPGNKFVFEDAENYYKTVNIYKFSKSFSSNCYIPFLEAYTAVLGNNEYYEQVLRVIAMLDVPQIEAKKLNGQLWYEIDDIQDLDIACSIFTGNKDEYYQKMITRYGGYWRYPKILDYTHLGNPFYPNEKMKNEIKVSFDKLITSYPSGERTINLLLSKNLDVEPEYIIAANGLEELINFVTEIDIENIGIVKPINKEYIQRCSKEKLLEFNIGLTDSSEELLNKIISFYDDKEIGLLVLSNPNHHIGKRLDKEHLIKLLNWGYEKNLIFLIDESASDYVKNPYTLVDRQILNQFHNLIIAKDISMSDGIAGLRLGCVISSNMDLIEKIKKKVPLWNINSFSEFYLQIAEKYQKDYIKSLTEFNQCKERFVNGLMNIPGIKVVNAESNFLLINVEELCQADIFAKDMLSNYGIMVKDLHDYLEGEFIRTAVKDERSNEYFVLACRNIANQLHSRVIGKNVIINKKNTQKFFDSRTVKKLPHRYNYVIYQDDCPELAIKRDLYEKEKILPCLGLRENSYVLDIGCGVGRWGDEIVKYLKTGKYIGVDFCNDFLNIAREELKDFENCEFYNGEFLTIQQTLEEQGCNKKFDVVLVNGILMYINDGEILQCLCAVDNLLKKDGIIYIKESVSKKERLTLSDFYSKELSSNYNAIYRSIDEYREIFTEVFEYSKYKIISEGETWKREQQNRSNTTSFYWIIKRME